MSTKDWHRNRALSQLPYHEVRDLIFAPEVAKDLISLGRRLDSLKQVFGQTNFILFVDCSPSMRNYHKQVREAFLTYVYLATQISVYGVEIGFSSEPGRHSSLVTALTAKTAFDQRDWSKSLFTQGFETFVTKTIIENISQERYFGSHLEILVLTDGIWGTEGLPGIQDSARRIESELNRHRTAPNILTLQFMRFGDDSDGTLSSLVDLKVSIWADVIVATSNYDADVRHVLAGVNSLPVERSARGFSEESTAIVGNVARESSIQTNWHVSGLAQDSIAAWVGRRRQSARSASEDKEVSSKGTAESDFQVAAATGETTTLSRVRVQPKYPAYTLPMFVGGLLDIWGLHPSPPPMSTRFRTTWECECGIQLSEEVSQLRPNGTESLAQAQPEPQDSEPRAFAQTLGVILTKSKHVISATIDVTCEAFKGLVPPKSNRIGSSLLLHNTNTNTASGAAQQNAQPDSWLLLCIEKGPRRTSFRQELFLDVSNDQALFDFLREKYFAHRQFRSWFTLRQMQSLALAQFRIDANGYPDIMDHHRYCLQKDGCDCIPPPDRVGESREYRCSPAPAEPPRLVPVLTPERLTHYFLRPHEFGDPQTYILEQLPKRSGPQLKAHPGKLAEGWGLYFQEGWHWASVAFICALFTFIGIIFGVVWSAVTTDIQSGFAVTAVFVAFPLLPLAFMFNRDSS